MEFEQSSMRTESEEELETTLDSNVTTKSRGPTTLSNYFKRNRGVKQVVEYKKFGQPVGLAATQLSSYLGVLARHMVTITHEKWSKVPGSLKNKIWCCLQAKFVLHPHNRKHLTKNVGELWRSFKSRLTRKFIMPYQDQADLLVDPPKMYKFIDKRHWESFVTSRLSTNFQIRREILSKRRKKNLYPHRLSRKGYAGLMEEMKENGELSLEELDRSILWKKARQNKEGVITHDATKERVKAIDKFTEQKNEGSLVTSGSKDILTLALETDEHSGNVRGMGKFVSQGAYFHTARPKMKEEREARLRVEAELQQTKERLALVEQQLSLMLQTQGGTAPACNSANTFPSSESEIRISRLEAQLSIFLKNQGGEAPITTQPNNPASSAGSSPKVCKVVRKRVSVVKYSQTLILVLERESLVSCA